MSARQAMLDYLMCKSNDYDKAEGLVLSGTTPSGDFASVKTPICERPIFHSGYDVFGVHWTASRPTAHYTLGQEPILTDIEDWREQVRIPVVERFDWESCAKEAESFDRENKVALCTLLSGPFERTTMLSSFEDCLVNAISEPEEYAELIGALADYKIKVIEHAHKYVKPDVMNLHDDWGTSVNTILSPELWREVIKPHTQRIYDRIHELGMLVGQHSCGNIEALIPDLVEMGCDIWEAQPDANDIPRLQAEFGDRLRILPANAKGDEAGDSVDAPPVQFMPLCFRPFDEVPTHLYE